eukprot:6187911-Pleurochrysis_carterae.AAC.3
MPSGLASQTYNMDWMRKYCGESKLALRPGSTGEVSKVLAFCNEHNIAVVPQGGNTGLVGTRGPPCVCLAVAESLSGIVLIAERCALFAATAPLARVSLLRRYYPHSAVDAH